MNDIDSMSLLEVVFLIKERLPSNYRCFDHNYKIRPKKPFGAEDFIKLIKKLSFLGMEKIDKYTFETDDYITIHFNINFGIIYVLDWSI